MLSKQSKVKQIESLMETAKLWTNLAERHLFDISSTLFESNKNNPEASATLSQDEQKFQLRYYNILGKLAQCQDDIQNASRYYEKCKSILELNPSLKEINIKRYIKKRKNFTFSSLILFKACMIPLLI